MDERTLRPDWRVVSGKQEEVFVRKHNQKCPRDRVLEDSKVLRSLARLHLHAPDIPLRYRPQRFLMLLRRALRGDGVLAFDVYPRVAPKAFGQPLGWYAIPLQGI